MINQDQIIDKVNELPSLLKQGLKGPGTARGIMIIVGIIILSFLHPEEARKYGELIAMAFVYGATDIFRRK